MNKNEFFISSALCRIYFHPIISLDKNEKLDLLTKLLKKCGELLDDEPTLLPISQDAPPNIPRLQLNSKNKSFAYGISLKNSDIQFNQIGEPSQKVTEISETLFGTVNQILSLYIREYHWKIARLALVVNYFAELNEKSSDYITSNFLCNIPASSQVELSLFKKDKIDESNVNRWFRIKSVEKSDRLLHLAVDINTLQEEKLNLNVQQMLEFFKKSIPYIEGEITGIFKGTINV